MANIDRRRLLLVLLALALAAGPATGCSMERQADDGRLRVAATTNIVTDLAAQIGGDRVSVTGLMGPGVDPHLYRASAGDVLTLDEADLILFVGLELEGKMADLLHQIGRTRASVPVTRDIPRSSLIAPDGHDQLADPHVWFSVPLWMHAARTVADALGEVDPEGRAYYSTRRDAYLGRLEALDRDLRAELARVPPGRRVLITSHDAFAYFGAEYGFVVEPIQGISTVTEATTSDIERVAGVIVRHELPAVFIESSVPQQTIDAVLASARQSGQRAQVGGELFSDSAGSAGTPEAHYTGMVRHNLQAIVGGLS